MNGTKKYIGAKAKFYEANYAQFRNVADSITRRCIKFAEKNIVRNNIEYITDYLIALFYDEESAEVFNFQCETIKDGRVIPLIARITYDGYIEYLTQNECNQKYGTAYYEENAKSKRIVEIHNYIIGRGRGNDKK